jgi:hypothetical protein
VEHDPKETNIEMKTTVPANDGGFLPHIEKKLGENLSSLESILRQLVLFFILIYGLWLVVQVVLQAHQLPKRDNQQQSVSHGTSDSGGQSK